MKISYAVTVCNELDEFKRLIEFLTTHIRQEDEIVVLQDISQGYSGAVKEIYGYCQNLLFEKKIDEFISDSFNKDFANWKNLLNAACHGDYIFQLDADEYPAEIFIDKLPELLDVNKDVELFWIPRNNTVEGLTQEDINKWHWRVDDQGRVNWPDYQGRIYKNKPDRIRWVGAVHERIEGHYRYAYLPGALCLYHPKKIEKQRQQNELYDKIAYERK